MRVVLLTRDSQHVADVETPPFDPMPEIVVWGLRSFVARPSASWAEAGAPEYGEAFAYYVPAIVEGVPCTRTETRVPTGDSDPIHVVTDPAQVDRTLGPDGQQRTYLVLSAEERAKGFVRPVRHSYKHVGIRPDRTRPLTAEEKERYAAEGYTCFEPYGPERAPVNGRYWTARDLTSGCGQVTRMGHDIAESYARNPAFYSATFCVGCKAHLPLAEFVWDGTTKRVGS